MGKELDRKKRIQFLIDYVDLKTRRALKLLKKVERSIGDMQKKMEVVKEEFDHSEYEQTEDDCILAGVVCLSKDGIENKMNDALVQYEEVEKTLGDISSRVEVIYVYGFDEIPGPFKGCLKM
jgi:septal ring factor EnvC (AmiA/AmiB activator)